MLGCGIDMSPEELQACLTGQTYPQKSVLDKLATHTDQDTAFAVACGCCLTGLAVAIHEFPGAFPESRGEAMVVSTVKGWADLYRSESGTVLTVEKLRRRILDAWKKIYLAHEGESLEKAVNLACVLIGRLDDETISIFKFLIHHKYRTAYGFFNALKANKRLS
jgi:hypothetical protein